MHVIVDAFRRDFEAREIQCELGRICRRDITGVARERERTVQSRRGGERPAPGQGQRRTHALRLTRRRKQRSRRQPGEISAARPATGIPRQFTERKAAA